jgi:hypothetical protein
MPKCSYLEHENNRHAFSAEDAQPRVRGRAMGSFFLLFTTGQNTAFSIPFSKIGLFLKAVKTVIRTMADRIAARGAFSTEEVAEGLAEPITVTGSCVARALGPPDPGAPPCIRQRLLPVGRGPAWRSRACPGATPSGLAQLFCTGGERRRSDARV